MTLCMTEGRLSVTRKVKEKRVKIELKEKSIEIERKGRYVLSLLLVEYIR